MYQNGSNRLDELGPYPSEYLKISVYPAADLTIAVAEAQVTYMIQ